MSTVRFNTWQDSGGTEVANSMLGTGKILQVVSTFVSASFGTTSTSFVDVTGHTATITPTAATSKVLVLYGAMLFHLTNGAVKALNLVRDGTTICQPAAGTVPATMNPYTSGTISTQHVALNFLDSPATTSPVVYKIQAQTSSGTLYVGGSTGTTTPANLTLLEVSA